MKLEEAKIKSSLKLLMKQQGLQYVDLAKALRISTATVKRRLNKGELNISELSEMASCLGTSFYELIEMSRQNIQEAYLFTVEQEKLFADDLSYLLIFRLIVMGQTFTQLTVELKVKEVELRKKLRRMEDVELIQLMPRDRINLLARFPFKWREDGLLQKAYHQKNLRAIFNFVQTHYKSTVHNEETGSLCRPFEFLLTHENKKSFAQDLVAVYKKYQNLSLLEINAKNTRGLTITGIIHLDEYSIWS